MAGTSEGARKRDPQRHAAATRAGRQRQTPGARSEGARKSHTPESDAKRLASLTETNAKPETKSRRSEGATRRWARPGAREQQSETLKDRLQDPEIKAKRAEIEARPEVKAAKSAGSRKRWDKPGAREHQSEKQRQSWAVPTPTRLKSVEWLHDRPMTGLEIKVLAAIAERGINLSARHIHTPVGRFNFDFFIESLNLDIECDSWHWHGHPDRVKRDAARDAKLKAAGYKILRLTEAEITAGDWIRLDEALGS